MYRYAHAALALLVFATTSWAAELTDPFTGAVHTVLEGDLLEVTTAAGVKTVRVFGVDSPDEGQPSFEDATSFTRGLVENAELVFQPMGTDIADRLVCEVVLPDGRDLSRELARSGWAWRYKAHIRDDLVLTRLTFEAMESKRGLWAATAPLAPWDHRGERPGDEVFFPFVDETIASAPAMESRPRTIDLSATDSGASEKSVTFNPDGSRRLVLKGDNKQSEADIAFIQNSHRVMRDAVAQRAEEKRANAQAYQNAVQDRVQTSIEISESRRYYPDNGYSIAGPVIISGGFGFPRAIILPPQRIETPPDPNDDDLWPYVRRNP